MHEMSNKPSTRFIPLSRFDQYHPWPSVQALRWMRFHGKKNGFNQCVLKVGKRILIDEVKFFEWLAIRNAEGKA